MTAPAYDRTYEHIYRRDYPTLHSLIRTHIAPMPVGHPNPGYCIADQASTYYRHPHHLQLLQELRT